MMAPLATPLVLCCLCALIVRFAAGAQLVAEQERRADLAPLINETLVINNKSSTAAGLHEEWTFDMVEYDLMDFLQDLNSRYANSKAANQSLLDAKSANQSAPSPAPEMSTSLADHEIAESSWQYGIFDRFTRPRSSTTTSSPSSHESSPDPLVEAAEGTRRNYNHDECGLRVYTHLEPEQQQRFADSGEEASKELTLRRQRPLLSPAERIKVHTEAELASGWNQDEQREPDEQRRRQQEDQLDQTEFNLASRRHWLQQQLGNTLQLLGQNASSSISSSQLAALELPAEKQQDWTGNKRENMMKMSSKLAKALVPPASAPERPDASLGARQDELKLEARVIGGTDARL